MTSFSTLILGTKHSIYSSPTPPKVERFEIGLKKKLHRKIPKMPPPKRFMSRKAINAKKLSISAPPGPTIPREISTPSSSTTPAVSTRSSILRQHLTTPLWTSIPLSTISNTSDAWDKTLMTYAKTINKKVVIIYDLEGGKSLATIPIDEHHISSPSTEERFKWNSMCEETVLAIRALQDTAAGWQSFSEQQRNFWTFAPSLKAIYNSTSFAISASAAKSILPEMTCPHPANIPSVQGTPIKEQSGTEDEDDEHSDTDDALSPGTDSLMAIGASPKFDTFQETPLQIINKSSLRTYFNLPQNDKCYNQIDGIPFPIAKNIGFEHLNDITTFTFSDNVAIAFNFNLNLHIPIGTILRITNDNGPKVECINAVNNTYTFKYIGFNQ